MSAATGPLLREPAAAGAPAPAADLLGARLAQQGAVVDLGRRALAGASLLALMDEATRLTTRTLGIECCQIMWRLPGQDVFLLRAAAGFDPALVGHLTVGAGRDTQVGYTMMTGEPVIVEDASTETRFTVARHVRERGIVSGVSVIIRGRAQDFGVLCAQTTRRRAVTSDDLHFLRALANILAMAAEREVVEQERAVVLARAESARREAESLAEIGRLVSQSLNVGEVAQRIANSILALLAVEAAAVLSRDTESGDLRVLAVAGSGLSGRPGQIAFPEGTGLSGLAVKLRVPVSTRDVLADPRITYTRTMIERLGASPLRSGLAVPLLADNAVMGVLAVGDRVRVFGDDDLRLADAFAHHAAVAIRNARLHEETRTRLRQTETLLAVSGQLTALLGPVEMMRRIAREICHAVGADSAGAFLADPEERHLRPIAGYHVPKHLLPALVTRPIPIRDHPVVEEAWARQAPVHIANVRADSRVDRAVWRRFRHRSNLFCPMIAQGKPIGGFVLVWWERRRELTPDEVALVEGISRQAGIALANARSMEELRARQGRLEAIAETARELSRIQPQAELLARVARACASIIGMVAVNIRVLAGDDLVLRGTWGLPKTITPRPRLKIGESLAGQVAATGEPLLLTDPYGDPRLIPEHRLHRQFFRYRAYLGLPLKMGDRIVGTMSVYTRRPEGFSAGDVAAAGAIASHVAVAIDNARLYREAQEARDRLQALSRSLVESRETERRHLARELHDEIGQVLTGLKLALEARHPSSAADASGNEATTQELLRDLIERVRGLSLDLRPQMLDDLGLLPCLRLRRGSGVRRWGLEGRRRGHTRRGSAGRGP
jgi:GAF domain-containing protein